MNYEDLDLSTEDGGSQYDPAIPKEIMEQDVFDDFSLPVDKDNGTVDPPIDDLPMDDETTSFEN